MRSWLPVVLAVAAACGDSDGDGDGPGGRGGGGPLEARLAADVAKQTGVAIARVRCPAGPAPLTCEAELPGGGAIEVAIRDDGDGTAWELVGVVIATAPLAAEIAGELADLGVTAKVDCGAPLRQAHRGARLDCTLDRGGPKGAAWATILDDDGAYRLEVALDPAVAEARTKVVDDSALIRTSEALDRDEAQGLETETESEDGADAGVEGSTRGSGT